MDRSISIVTVTRNAADLLKRTIESVGRQKYDKMEYVVIDGASDDGSVKAISESQLIDKWISEPDKGIYDAMNKGARMATGEWILFMNAGDTFAGDDVVSRLMTEAGSHPDADVIYGDVIRCGNASGEGTLKEASDVLKGHRLAFCHQSVICKRKDLLENPFDIRHKYSADFKFFKTLHKQNKNFIHVNFPVARFDVTGVSTRNRSKGLADNMKVILEVDGLSKGLPSMLHLLPTYIMSRIRGK